jgi:hypothetical protein
MDAAILSLITGELFYLVCPRGPTPLEFGSDRCSFSGWSFLNTEHDLIIVEDLQTDRR